MGDASGPHARILYAQLDTRSLTLHAASKVESFSGSAFDFLEKDLADLQVEPQAALPFGLGWVGYFGYELKAECGGTEAHASPDPDATWIFADRAIVFDHHKHSVSLLALAPARTCAQAKSWLDITESNLAGAPPRLRRPKPIPLANGITHRHNKQSYLRRIQSCKESIADGDCYEICLTNMLTGKGSLPALDTYRLLRGQSPTPFSAYFRCGDIAILSASPERFLSIDRNGTLETKPIKGTRRRSSDPGADAALIADLANCEKDQAENLMIVDLVRNDLGRCAEIGSVHVPEFLKVESYATVHQLVSTVRATMRQSATAMQVVRACFPGGSMTGAPKIRTMQLLDDLEGAARGIYSGALGYFSLNGTVDLSMVIRTLIVRKDSFSYGTGGAIVDLSDPEQEYDEIQLKAQTLMRLFAPIS